MSGDNEHERHQLYTTVVIGAAYAGIFAAWGNTKDQLSDTANALIAISTLVSLTLFVLFEITKVWRAMSGALPASTFKTYWRITFIITVGAGAFAASVLCAALVAKLTFGDFRLTAPQTTGQGTSE